MRVLLDHCVPKPFRRELAGHEVRTAFEMGWADLDNGALLAEAAKSFAAFITVDQNIEYQRNLTQLPLPVLVLVTRDTDPQALKPFGPLVLTALAGLQISVLLRVYEDGRIETVETNP